MQSLLTRSEELKESDRCDRCGARAYIKAVFPGDLDLLFCNHHGRPALAKLKASGAEIQDESHRLN